MWEVLSVYSFTLVTATLCAAALAWSGMHLAARDLSLKSILLGQATQVGILLGVLAAHSSESLIYLSGILFSLLVYKMDLHLVQRFQFGKSSILLSIFILLLAASHWLVAFFPGLEKHASQAYFGDVVTITGFQQIVALVVAASSLGYMALQRKFVLKSTFDQATYLPVDQDAKLLQHDKAFLGFAFILLVTCIFSLGLVFTIGCILIPTSVLNLIGVKNIRSHEILCLLVASLGTLCGFSFSLLFENVSTVPTILGAMVLLAVFSRFVR